MLKLVIQKLISDSTLVGLLNNNKAVFMVEKPDEEPFKDWNPYIIYKYKPIGKGYIKDYQVEFDIVCKDLKTAVNIQESLIRLIDDPRNKNKYSDENNTIYSIELTNGGGSVKNPETGNYQIVLFFIMKAR